MYQKRKSVEKGIITLVDAACLIISMVAAFRLRYHIFMGISRSGEQLWLLPLTLVILVMANMIFEFSHHLFRQGYLKNLTQVIKQQMVVAMALVVVLYLLHQATILSRLVFSYFIGINTVLTYIGHLLLKQYMTKVFRKSKYSNRLLVVATQDKIQDAIRNIVRFNEWNRILMGIALLDKDAVGQRVENVPVIANTRTFMDYVIHHDIDEVFIMDSERLHDQLVKEWIKELEQMGIIVDVNIDVFDVEVHGKKTLNRVGKYAVVTFARNIFSTRQILAKRMLDIVGSLVGMAILGIATVFVAPAIKLESPGPVFFGQTRIGKNGRRFTFYKFRSMYKDAEARKKELMAKNEVQGLMFKMEDDPRITKVGKFIRKTSIDELPQFWNVLRGDMSLVGTRPPTVDEFEQYEAKHKCRLSMTPGLTGMWQISGRSDIKDFDEVVKLDMQYIDNWTILKDIEILIMTVFVVFAGKGSR